MPCDGCGRDVYPLHYYPTKVAHVTHKLRQGQGLCDRCLKQRLGDPIEEKLPEKGHACNARVRQKLGD